MAFVVFNKKVQYGGSPAVTFTTNGRLAFNKAATAKFEKHDVEYVLLLWDAEGNRIGVQPIAKKTSQSYTVHFGKNGNGCGFSAATFLSFVGYNSTKTNSLPTIWDENQAMFVVEVPVEYLKKDSSDVGNTESKGK